MVSILHLSQCWLTLLNKKKHRTFNLYITLVVLKLQYPEIARSTPLPLMPRPLCVASLPVKILTQQNKRVPFSREEVLPRPTQIAKLMGPTWGPTGSCRPQMGPMLALWTLLSQYGFSWVLHATSWCHKTIEKTKLFSRNLNQFNTTRVNPCIKKNTLIHLRIIRGHQCINLILTWLYINNLLYVHDSLRGTLDFVTYKVYREVFIIEDTFLSKTFKLFFFR